MDDDELTQHRVSLLHAVADTLLGADGDLDPRLRRAAFGQAVAAASGAARAGDELPEPLAGFVDTVVTKAYTVADDDVDSLRAAGYGEDAILEAVLATATGAGLARLDIGMAALAGRR